MTKTLQRVISMSQCSSRKWAATSVALLSVCLVGCGENFNPRQTSSETDTAALGSSEAPLASEGASRDIAVARNPKNAVIFIGDGMGVSTVTAGRIYAGQKRGVDGESYALSWEDFPQVGLVKTYNYDSQVPDSAGTATAILSGYRARIGQVNIEPEPDTPGPTGSCDKTALPPTLLELSKAANKRVGVVSTARITHATPAALYGHAFSRGWEAPNQVPENARAAGCTSLGEQLAAAPLDLVMGGGNRLESVIDFERYNKITELSDITLPAMALFTDSHMSYEADRAAPEPSLSEMTEAAIAALDSDDGYVLLIEAGRIDHAHHATNAYRALEDLIALDEAVATAKRLTGDDTLILVTADHSHVVTMQGYPARGNPILGLVHNPDEETRLRSDKPALSEDGRPYTTLSYANGPVSRDETDFAQAESPDFRQPAGRLQGSETHGGDDVPLYATGAGSGYFGGVMDQPEVGQAIHKALGLTEDD